MRQIKAFGIFAILGDAIQNHRISHKDRSIAWAYLKVDRFFILPTIAYEYVEYDLNTGVEWVGNKRWAHKKIGYRLGATGTYYVVTKKEWVKRFFFIWGNEAIRINYGCRTGFPAVQD